jgi:nucleotide-binding universal stress UspA family protein
MYDRLLLPTDGERGAERAIDHALELAAAVDATVHALYVVDESIYGAYSGDEFVQEHEGPQSTLEENGQEALARISDEAATAGVEVETAMRYGRPAAEIVAEADDVDANLVVLGTRTRSDEYRQLVGRVAERVLRLTHRPVTVIKTPEPEA